MCQILPDYASYYYFFPTGLEKYRLTLWEEKLHSLPSYVADHVCDLFLYPYVNVNSHFEAIFYVLQAIDIHPKT